MTDEYDLLKERWIPVRYRDGHVESVAPHEIVGPLGDHGEPVDLAWPRPDFNGAMIQFLIGLVQTTFAPRNRREWRRRLTTPPTPEELAEAFACAAPAFVLRTGPNGGGFMQDPGDLGVKEKDEKPAAWLLIDAPTDNTIKTNKDHFTHSLDERALSLPEAAAALYTLQTFAPGGGPGHRTSLRGGGPLTTLVLGKSLWETVWLSVLSTDDFESLGNAEDYPAPYNLPAGASSESLSAVFPWLAPANRPVTSNRDEPTTRDEAHPLQMFWAMPRRIQLRVRTDQETGERRVTHFITRPRGANYDGSWEHPLSPYGTTSGGVLIAAKGSGDRLSYNHWVGLVTNRTSARPALVVRALPSRLPATQLRRHTRGGAGTLPQLWAFGYDMDNAKARLWIESRQIPVILADPAVEDSVREALEETVEQLATGAGALADALKKHLREAVLGRPELERGRLRGTKVPKTLSRASGSILEQAERRFWTDTEPIFLAAVEEAHTVCAKPDAGFEAIDDRLREVRWDWLKTVRNELLVIFDDASALASDPATRVIARQRLSLTATPTAQASRDVCKALGLPLPEKPSRKKPAPATSSP